MASPCLHCDMFMKPVCEGRSPCVLWSCICDYFCPSEHLTAADYLEHVIVAKCFTDFSSDSMPVSRRLTYWKILLRGTFLYSHLPFSSQIKLFWLRCHSYSENNSFYTTNSSHVSARRNVYTSSPSYWMLELSAWPPLPVLIAHQLWGGWHLQHFTREECWPIASRADKLTPHQW